MRRLILTLAVFVGTILVVMAGYFLFVVGDATGEGESFLAYRNLTGAMEPTLLIGETFTAVSLRSEKGELLPVRRGDVVVHRWPPDTSKVFAKRVVGVPGDTLEMRNGILFVDGGELAEPYAWHAEPNVDPAPDDFGWQQKFLVGQVAGDTGTHTPSRNNWGPISLPPGQYFVLGDNRDNSLDSRYWGFLPAENIIAQARRVYRSRDPKSGIRWKRLGRRIH